MGELKRTPIYEEYKKSHAKTIDFGGWELPVQFSSIKEEHHAVRTSAGLFDVSHMGEILVEGRNSELFLQKILTNDISKLIDGKAMYAAMCYETGGTVDDLLVYKKNNQSFMIVVNASNIEKDWNHLNAYLIEDVKLTNISDDTSLLAIQGPLAEESLQPLINITLSELPYFSFKEDAEILGVSVLISRTGYTGEEGFEIYCKSHDAVHIWRGILQQENVIPCGLGARDTLRFEACLPLYGQELSKDITPLEAGIGFAVKLHKVHEFIGQSALIKQKEDGIKRKLVGIEMIDKGIPRHDYSVYVDEKPVGFVTSGTQSPTLKKNIGLALLDVAFSNKGQIVEVEIRGKKLKAKVIAKPFYKKA